MILEETPLAGLLLVRPEPVADERGFFARVWSSEDFAAAGVTFQPVQSSISVSTRAGTLRGMHWQAAPHGEVKLVRVTQGAVFDVAVDLRAGSATLGRWFGLELSAANRLALLIPRGFAHGLITLADDSEVLYAMDTPYVAASARGARHNDPAFGIAWPRESTVIGARDRAWPNWNGSGE
jgi:dTDP-4-dehydrorhamnose 3,5-epimerase